MPLLHCICRLLADFVAKVFLASGRETLIQNLARARNVDSRTHSPRVDYFKFQFYRAGSETFATKSARSRLMRCSKQSPYSITSSAMESSDGGTVMPNIRAVRWLMTSSNFDACTTGNSA